MQKVINLLAVLGFVGSASVIGGGVYVYVQREAITENIKSQIMEGVAGAISEQIGDLGSITGGVGALPEAPSAPGGGGSSLPSFP